MIETPDTFPANAILTEEAIRRQDELRREYDEALPLDDVNINRYTSSLLRLVSLLKKEPELNNSALASSLELLSKKFYGRWKYLDIILRFLEKSVEVQTEKEAQEILEVMANLVESTGKKNVKEANRIRRQIGFENRFNMKKYYEPIREYDKDKFHRIIVFQKQFDLYWNEHGTDIQQRSQRRKSRKKMESGQNTSDKPCVLCEKPHKRYPAYFANFRTGFYRWQKRYESDAQILQGRKNTEKLVELLQSLQNK